MPPRKPLEQIINSIREVHGDLIEIDATTYGGMDTLCRFVDKECGEFWNRPYNLIHKKQSHPARRKEKTKKTLLLRYGTETPKLNTSKYDIEYLRQIASNHGGKCLSDSCNGIYKKYQWECENGHTWSGIAQSVQNGHWCMQCYRAARVTTIEKCIEIAEKNNGQFLSINEKDLNAIMKLKWKCIKHERIFEACYNNIRNGQWCKICAKDKRAETNTKKYGFPYLMQNKDLAITASRTKNEITTLKHWRNHSDVYCRGSYEVRTVQYLNINKIPFLWQPQTFIMPDKRTYTPDLFLVDTNLWVEIKGRWYDDAKEKWDWFNEEHPNSELWDKKKLKSMEII